MKQVILIGGGGYLGVPLARKLLSEGFAVKIMDRFYFGTDALSSLQDLPGFSSVRADIRSLKPSDLEGAFAVMNLAALSNDPSADLDPEATMSINRDGCLHAAGIAKKAGVPRFVFFSSCSVYGNNDASEVTEESEVHPVSLYARTKVEAERGLLDLKSKQFSPTILRNATAFGYSPRMRFDLALNLMTMHAFTKGRIVVQGGGQQWRPLVHADDIADAAAAVLARSADEVSGEIYNVGSDANNFQILTLAYQVRDHFSNVSVDVIVDDPDRRSYKVSFRKCEKLPGFRVKRSVSEGIEEIKKALESGRVNANDPKTVTLRYYRFLLDAQKTLGEVAQDGRIF